MDEAAFRDLYRETAPRLHAYIRRAAGDAALADDILQDTFLRFLRSGPAQLEPRRSKAYLYRIAISLLADHWRRVGRERRWRLLEIFREEAQKPLNPGPGLLGGDMAEAFASLKPHEQAMLWLAYVEGFDHQEIAASMRLRQRSVRVLLFRARRRLAGILRERGVAPVERV